jgi:putative peptidoglycan lipid II flippase
VQFEPVTVLGVTIPAGALASLDARGLPLGPLGLAVGAALGAWVEWALLKRTLAARLGSVGAGAMPLARMSAAAVAAAAAGIAVSLALPNVHALTEAVLVAASFGCVYFGVAAALGLEQARALLRRLRRAP